MEDLRPATWYSMKVTAHSDAGSTECNMKFATLTYSGSEFNLIIQTMHFGPYLGTTVGPVITCVFKNYSWSGCYLRIQ